jgi:hypothetical protein
VYDLTSEGKAMSAKEIESSLSELAGYLDRITNRLRIYDTAMGMAELNNPGEATIFKFWMTQAENLPELKPSREYELVLQRLRELFARVAQESKNPRASETSQSGPKQLPEKRD